VLTTNRDLGWRCLRGLLGVFVAVVALEGCSSSHTSSASRSCDAAAVPSNPTLSANETSTARAAILADPAIAHIVAGRQVAFGPPSVWIGDCGQVLGVAQSATLDRVAEGTAELPIWQCVNGVSDAGLYRTDLDGMSTFSVTVDLRAVNGVPHVAVAAVQPGVPYEQIERIGDVAYPDDGLACRTGD
jgi:hypothetical protein